MQICKINVSCELRIELLVDHFFFCISDFICNDGRIPNFFNFNSIRFRASNDALVPMRLSGSARYKWVCLRAIKNIT